MTPTHPTPELVALLACPFCGSPAEFDRGGFGEIFAVCTKCWCHMGGAWATDEETAARGWNTRAATVPQGVSVDVAELVGAVKAVQFDVYELTTPDLIVAFGGKTRIAVVDVDSVKSLRAAVAGMTPPLAELGKGS